MHKGVKKMYQRMFQYVKDLLLSYGDEAGIGDFPFRKRSEHIKRVFKWAERITYEEPDIDRDAVLTAAIFHDVGYSVPYNGLSHAENGAVICEKYLKENNFDAKFIDLVVYLVKNHSRKELMTDRDVPKELILLMEADLLDETGALSIVWDCMSEGNEEIQSFEKTYNHLLDYSYQSMELNPMITPKARALWEKKKELVESFISHLKCDLALDDGELTGIRL